MDRLDRLEELLDDYKGNILNETGVSSRTQDELAMLLADKPVLTEAFECWLRAAYFCPLISATFPTASTEQVPIRRDDEFRE